MKKLLVVLAVLAGIVFSGCVRENEMATHITTLEQLQAMKDNLAEDYILDNDIDASATSGWNGGAGFIPIGDFDDPFTGSFDGGGHTVSNLFINRPSSLYQALFGKAVTTSEIKDIILENPDITGDEYVAGLLGVIGNDGNISGCGIISGSITGEGDYYAGGLIALAGHRLTISKCYSTGAVSGGDGVGGLIAQIPEDVSMSNCYSRMSVDGGDFVGGLVGTMPYSGAVVDKCYSSGAVTGTGDNVGGLVGYKDAGATVSNSFWDTETSGQASSAGGTGKTTVQMKTKSTFTDAGWDFNTIWDICELPDYTPSYPWLQWENIECTAVDKEAPWDEDTLEPTSEVKVEIPRRSGEWTTLGNVMRIHTSNGKDTSSPRAPIEIGQAEVTCSNIDKDFNSFEEASDWYKNLEGYAIQIKVGCDIGGFPISVKLFTGIISSVDVDRLNQTAEIRMVDFLDYFGRITLEETPIWENISLTQLFKNLIELAFTDWTHGVDYFVEDLGGSTIPAIGYTDLNLLSELKMIAESRGKRIYTDTSGRLHCASRNPDRDPLTVSYDYNLEDVTERRDINSIINWIVVHARPHEIKPDLEPPGKIAGFTATPGDTKIDLSWSNPTDDDFVKVMVRYSTTHYPLNIEDGTNIYEGTGTSKSHTGLTNGKKYYYSAFTVDDVGNWSDAAHTSAVAGAGGDTWADETGPSEVSNFEAAPVRLKVVLTWQNPDIADFNKVVIRRSTADYPSSPTGDTSIYNGTGETVDDTSVVREQLYYYSAFVKNTGGQWSSGIHASATLEERIKVNSYIVWDIYGGAAYSNWTNYTWSKLIRFQVPAGLRAISSWYRFKHKWDIECRAREGYHTNQTHIKGETTNLQFDSNHNCDSIATVRLTKVSSLSSEVKVQYHFAYTGGGIYYIKFRNELILMA